MTLQMEELFATDYPMNSNGTNIGGWKSSDMRTYMMATMKGYLPDDWESIIKSVNKDSGVGGSSSEVETVSDNCFLLSEVEIFGAVYNSVPGEGTQYAYYKVGNSTVKNKDGYAGGWWWTRSPYESYPGYFCIENGSGLSDSNSAELAAGVCFGFCV